MGNTLGKLYTLTSFGESHGRAIGGVIDGVPAGFSLDINEIQRELDRRKPGQSAIVTQRKESDTVQFLSGIFEGKTTGAPIGFIIENNNQKSVDYEHLKDVYRPSHADFTYAEKYGIRDYRGGGRASARETANWVVAGAIAKQFLKEIGVQINSFVTQVGTIILEQDPIELDIPAFENEVRCPDTNTAERMIEYIKGIRAQGDTVGGIVFTRVTGVPIGLGAPVFDKLQADLGKAMLSINAVKGFDYGSGFGCVTMKGSEHNDSFLPDSSTQTNYSGGIQGGISNGMPIYFRVAFKPVATLMQKQQTIDKAYNSVEMMGKGRHDACVVPRAVPIVEAMTAITLFDHYLRNKITKL